MGAGAGLSPSPRVTGVGAGLYSAPRVVGAGARAGLSSSARVAGAGAGEGPESGADTGTPLIWLVVGAEDGVGDEGTSSLRLVLLGTVTKLFLLR